LWSWGSVDAEISFGDSDEKVHGGMRWRIDLEDEKLPYGLAKNGFLAIVGQARKAFWAKGRDHIQGENFPSAGLGDVASTKPDYLDHPSDDQDIEVWCLAMAERFSVDDKRGEASTYVVGLILRPIESPSQLTPTNLDWLRTAISQASILKEDGTYWDKQFNEPILRHTDMPNNPNLTFGEISTCKLYLFQRLGSFELHYGTNTMLGYDQRAFEEEIAEEKEKSKWFNDCPRHLVYVI
jgi:hypothetical protein